MQPDGKSEETLFDPGKRLRGLTPAYASLEMWNRESPDPRDDIYALACVTYELLSGQHPFDRLSAKTAVARNLAPQRIEALSRAQWEGLQQGTRRCDASNARASVSHFIKPFAPQSTTQQIRRAGGCRRGSGDGRRARRQRTVLPDRGRGFDAGGPAMRGDSQARRAAIRRRPSPRRPHEQQQEINDNLALAGDYMRDVSPSTGIDDLKYILSDGANSVNDILDAVLRIDPAHAGALKLKGEVANVYAARAKLCWTRAV